MKKTIALFMLATCLLTPGCSNIFHDYYTGSTPEQIEETPFIETCKEPRYLELPDAAGEALMRMLEEGYEPVGNSTFKSYSVLGWQGAYDLAKDLGACAFSFRMEHEGAISGMETVTTRLNTETLIQGTIKNRRHDPGIEYEESGSTYDELTSQQPYTRNKLVYRAIFMVRSKKNPFGVYLFVPDGVKPIPHYPYGPVVQFLVKDSPAYKANFFKGDVITRVNGKSVDEDSFYDALRYGAVNSFTLQRDGGTLQKEVYVPNQSDK